MPHPTDRRQRKRERTAAHLSATAFALFEAHGYDSVSMEQIADEADVAKATLYNYFPVKEALLAHRFREDIAAGMVERASALAAHETFEARMRYLLRESAAWHAQRRTYLPHYLRFLTSRAHYGEQGSDPTLTNSDSWQILAAMFRAAQDSGQVTKVQSAEQIAWSFQYLLFAAISAWLIDPGQDLTERFLAAFDLAMHGVAQPPQDTQAVTKGRPKR
jgi:AcrR family transcriptional regulator